MEGGRGPLDATGRKHTKRHKRGKERRNGERQEARERDLSGGEVGG